MIGVFDSGLGGLTVLRALVERFPRCNFLYLGDQAHVPYGDRPAAEIVGLTRRGVSFLFDRGCRLVLLGCNTATAVAARTLQRDWLPGSPYVDRRILGIVAPTVEAATQTPWAVTTPQYPQKNNTDLIAIFGTTRTVDTGVFPEEIRKRCPKVNVVQQACPGLAGAIEARATPAALEQMIATDVAALLQRTNGRAPDRAILGCTHYPLVEDLFRKHLPASTRLLSQPDIVADSLDDYLLRHPQFLGPSDAGETRLLTTASARDADLVARLFWPACPPFAAA